MKNWLPIKWQAALWLVLFGVMAQALATPFQLVSGRDPGQEPPAGGSGDSCLPLLSPDGRFVLFASTANNLVLASNGLPIPALTPARLNVYLRDRSNATTVLASVNLTGTGGGNGDSFPAGVSLDGRYAIFESSATDIVARSTNAATDIFVRDFVTGTTRLVSLSTAGLPGNRASRSAVMTPDGRYVAFVSAATNLVTTDTNGIPDVFVRDLQTGVTTLASAGATATNFTNFLSSSEAPDITPDGRFVAFFSTATNLVPGVTTTGDLYIRDLLNATTHWASAYARDAMQSVTGTNNAVSFNHSLSADGRFLAYEASPVPLPASAFGIILRYDRETGATDLIHTNAAVTVPAAVEESRSLDATPDGRFIAFAANTNVVSGTNTFASTCLLVWDADTGTTVLASGDLSNAVPASSTCDWPALDASGRYVAFLSDAPGLVTNALVGTPHLYLRDLQASTKTLVNADPNGVGTPLTYATAPQLSADARFVAFECPDGQLVPNDRNHDLDVFVRDVIAGTNELISAHDVTLPSQTANGLSFFSANGLSADGRYIAFASDADNVAGTDTNGWRDVFVRDMATGSNRLVSADTSGLPGNGLSTEASISGDGRYVAFTSSATNLVTGDANKLQDVFVRDLQAGTNILASRRFNGSGSGSGNSYSPVLSADGRQVVFRSAATDLVSGSFRTYTDNLFFRSLSTGTNIALTFGGMSTFATTPDGRFVAYYGALVNGYTSNLYVWDSQSKARVYTNSATRVAGLGISPNGNRLAYVTLTELRGADRAAKTNWLISAIASGSKCYPRFSGDGAWLTYARVVGSSNQIYLYDFAARTERLVSHAFNSSNPAQGQSDVPDISADGRFVAYRSMATNVVAGDTNGTSDIFLYDRLSDANALLNVNRSGSSADRQSPGPVFSADGRMLALRTWASDAVPQDFNESGDVLAYTLLSVVILPPSTPGQGPWLSWPWAPGGTYQVQFKNRLSDPTWQALLGNITNQGAKAYLQDTAPADAQRFYRINAN